MRYAASILIAAALGAQTPHADFGTTVVASSGFRGNIYFLHHWVNRLPGNLEKRKPVGTIYTPILNVPPHSFSTGFPGVTKRFEYFAIDYHAPFWIETPGEYRFALVSDDGADLYIDGKLVIDNDGQHMPIERFGSVTLSRGVHHMHVPYYQGPRWMVALVLKVAPPGSQVFRIFDTNQFKPPVDAPDWDSNTSKTPDK